MPLIILFLGKQLLVEEPLTLFLQCNGIYVQEEKVENESTREQEYYT